MFTLPSKEWLLDAVERVAMTALAAFFTAWLASPTFDVEQNKAMALAAVTTAVTAVKAILTGLLTGGGSVVPATSVAAKATTSSRPS